MTSTDVALAAPLIANLFPAVVRKPSGEVAFTKVRAAITPEWLVVYAEVDGEARTVAKIVSLGARPHPKSSGAWIVTADDGEWTVARGSGCRCGGALRTMPSPIPLDL